VCRETVDGFSFESPSSDRSRFALDSRPRSLIPAWISEQSDEQMASLGLRPGRRYEVVRTGEGDPGTESTSRMIVESALCLAQDSGSIAFGGGSWTPPSAMAELLLPRLTANAGLSFELDPAASDRAASVGS